MDILLMTLMSNMISLSCQIVLFESKLSEILFSVS